MLLTADAESDITGPLELPPVEAMKVAHHGSDDPGLPALLARTHPAFAGIEVGRGNTYGHPTAPRWQPCAPPSRTSTAPTATAPSASTSTAAGVHVERAP